MDKKNPYVTLTLKMSLLTMVMTYYDSGVFYRALNFNEYGSIRYSWNSDLWLKFDTSSLSLIICL